MTNQAHIAALLSLIEERGTFIISSHTRPDGDAIGSSLGLMHVLEGLGKRAVVAFTDSIPDTYHCLPGVERIHRHLPATVADAAIFLECDSLERSSFDRCEFEGVRPPFTINIDHHASGRDFANFNWIDSQAPAVGAMIYDLALASGVRITSAMASCLYAAILTDTGSFAYSGVTASTFGMAEHLVACGADPYTIAQAVFFSNRPAKVRLLGTALNKIRIEDLRRDHKDCSEAGKIAWCAVTLDDMDRAGADIEDCEGVVSHLIGIAGVEAAVFMRELSSGAGFRLSLRSKGAFDIAGVAERFGGGGHRNASGCNIAGSLADVTRSIVAQLRAAATQLQSEPATDHLAQPATLLA